MVERDRWRRQERHLAANPSPETLVSIEVYTGADPTSPQEDERALRKMLQ